MSRDRKQLNPLLNIIIDAFLKECDKQKLNVKITDCVRTKEEQNGIDASRTQTKYPYSFHNWGLAFDICQNSKTPYPTDENWWKKVGAIGEKMGLEWGGNWKGFVDKPHFQLNAYGTVDEMIKRYGTPAELWKTDDWKVTTPVLPIKKKSVFRKRIWLQAMLCINGYKVNIDGIYGKETANAYAKFLKDKYQYLVTEEGIKALNEGN